MWKTLAGIVVAVAAVGFAVAPAQAVDPGYTLFGEASLVTPGSSSPRAAQLVSDADPGFGGVSIEVPTGLTFGDIDTLGTDFNVTDDNCGGGSPRFQVRVDTGGGVLKNAFVYLGPPPNYNTCTPNTWVSSGNLADDPDFVDTTQLGGTFYDTFLNAQTNYGSYPVVGLSVVADAGWAFGDGEQTILVDTIMINDMILTFDLPTNKDECKKGGWEALGFKNQGQCVSSVVSQRPE